MNVSRRLLLRVLGLSGAAALSSTAPATASAALEIEGCVSWCHRERGYLKFRPLRRDAAERLIKLDVRGPTDVELLRRHTSPLTPIVLRLAWRPDIDILAPWQAIEVVFMNGERLAARREINNIS